MLSFWQRPRQESGPAWPDARLVRWVERLVLGIGLTAAVFGLGFVSGWIAHMGQVAAALAQLQADRQALARTHHLPPAGHPWLAVAAALIAAGAGAAAGYFWGRRRGTAAPDPGAAAAGPTGPVPSASVPAAPAAPETAAPLPDAPTEESPPESPVGYILGPLLRAFTWWAIAAFLALIAWQSGYLAQSRLLP